MILITRPKREAHITASLLADRGLKSIIDPLLEIHAKDQKNSIKSPQLVIFTSINGVTFCPQEIVIAQPDVYAVGDSTAQAAKEKGFKSVVSAKGDVEDLYQLILEKRHPHEGSIVHLSGEITIGNLVNRLKQQGYQAEQVKIYASREASSLSQQTIHALEQEIITSALFFSPRTASIFKGIITTNQMTHFLKNLSAFCISSSTADALKDHSWKSIKIAAHPHQNALLKLLETNKR